MEDFPARLRAIADLKIAEIRDEAGRHEYDGTPADLSPDGVRRALERLGKGERFDDRFDEAHVRTVEGGLRYAFGELQTHRWNPLPHFGELDLSGYDKEYAPEPERRAARDRHLAAWPEVVGAAVDSLDRVSAPVAAALLPPARGLAAAVPDDAPPKVRSAALAAHQRLVAHLEQAAANGEPSAALGGTALTQLMNTSEGESVDLGRLAEQVDAERDRLTERLTEAAARIDPERAPLDLTRDLVRDHPDTDGVLDEARRWVCHAIDFTRERDLVPFHDGECVVRPTPEAHRWGVAMLVWAGPAEPEGPSYYYISPPSPDWPAAEADEWLQMFSTTTLPAISVHEVAPGHFSHGRALRKAPTLVRRTLFSMAFCEGWAHYGEELCVEEGFGAFAERRVGGGGHTAARVELGVWHEALVRVTRLASAIGVHTGAMTVQDAARRFATDTTLAGPAALAEARRATFDPTYGRYTWGKLRLMRLREQARERWGSDFSLKRFHSALLDLGAPPLGLVDRVLRHG